MRVSRSLLSFLFGLHLFFVFWTTPVRGEDGAAGAPAVAATAPPPAEVRVGEQVLFRLQHGQGKVSAQARAQAASAALERALALGNEEVRARWLARWDASDAAPVDPASALVRLSVGQLAVLELTWRDLDTADQREAESLVSDLSKSIESALLEERERMKVADKILAASSVVFLGLLTLLFVRAVGRWSRAARHFSHREDANLRPIQIGSVELIPAGAVRELMRVGALGGGWLLRAVLVYFWAIWSLSLFDSTRGLAQTATGTLLGPLGQLLGRIASQIPVLLALLVTLLVVALIMRFVAAYFHGIERGEIASEWVHPATARITGGLALVALGLVTLLFVAPLVTGSAEGVFSQLGLLALSALALATSPMMVSCALGVRLVYSRSLRLGDELEYGGKRGLVRRVGLFDVTLSDPRGGTIKVPHLMSLWHATQVFPPEPLPPDPAPLDEEEAGAP